MVSYEVSIGFVIITVLLCVGSLNLSDIVEAQRTVWFAIPLLPMFVIFFISALAETNRAPFDLPEGESELVAGYFVEYRSEEQTSELQSLMRISYAVFCLKTKKQKCMKQSYTVT